MGSARISETLHLILLPGALSRRPFRVSSHPSDSLFAICLGRQSEDRVRVWASRSGRFLIDNPNHTLACSQASQVSNTDTASHGDSSCCAGGHGACPHNDSVLLRDCHPPEDTGMPRSNRGTSEMAEGLPETDPGHPDQHPQQKQEKDTQ